MKITTPQFDVLANNTSTEIFTPGTGALNSVAIKMVNYALRLSASGSTPKVNARLGVQFSNNGIDWTDTPKGVFLDGAAGSAYATADGWNFSTSAGYTDITALSGITPRLHVRFGTMSVATANGNTEGAEVQLLLDVKNWGQAQSLTFGPIRVHCFPDATTWKPIDFSGPLPAAALAEARATLEILSTTGTIDLKVTAQFANSPNTPVVGGASNDWGGDIDLVTVTNGSAGITYATTFTTLTNQKPWIRYVVYTRGSAGNTAIRAALASIRIDHRG